MKHNYAEAFHLMQYQNERTGEIEWVWNSRDGVTPFIIGSRDGKDHMKHIAWNRDIYLPSHKPNPGDRVFVDTTPDIARPQAQEYVDRLWDTDTPNVGKMKDHPFFSTMTKAQAVDYFVKEWVGDGTQPHIVEAK